ncbi:PAC2 family protein [Candidatus Woesearchaeota archaeon]|nr:PAC2 family protein [Candidatus Woesearchaeota archaeon]
MNWTVKYTKKPRLTKPVLIEGLPGIGTVGKLAADYLIDSLKAKKCGELTGPLPATALITEQGLIQLPKIELYNKDNILILTGDVQPNEDQPCYTFCEKILDIAQELNCAEIITLGGVGLKEEPKEPQVYVTGNTTNAIKTYEKLANKDLYGIVGPVLGVTGILPALAEKRNLPAISLLAETSAHPLHLGFRAARNILKVIEKRTKTNLNLKLLDKDIQEIEKEDMPRFSKFRKKGDVNYIG